MYYPGLKRLNDEERSRAVDGLRRLREQQRLQIPTKDSENSLLLATWNIRDLTKSRKRRLQESLYYIAEVISKFDFVAVQEVNGLEEWDEVMQILGRQWDYIATDVADRKAGGNGERLTYVYDRRKVNFQNIAGELVLPRDMLISKQEEEGRQFSRTPFSAMFQSGWFKFSICTVHIYFGDESGAKLRRRIEEIANVAEYFGDKADAIFKQDGRSMVLLGDFNIVSPTHKTMMALEDNGFKVPASLRNKPSNQTKTKHYDQIAFKAEPGVLEFVDRACAMPNQCNSGVFDFYESVFREDDETTYDGVADRGTSRFRTWRSYQMSDHLPMWVRLDVNDADEYIDSIA